MKPIPPKESRQIDVILNQWREEAAAAGYSKERIKGTAFEQLCKAFLTHDPTQKTQYEPPVHYGEWARAQGLPETDLGIDLVAKVRSGEGWCAIQCKFWAKGKRLQKADIAQFLAAFPPGITRRLLIDTTGKDWGHNADALLRQHAIPVARIGLHELRQSPIDWSQFVETEEVTRPEPKTPRPHQEEAIRKAMTGLADEGSRGKLIMACGTGKTFTSLRIAEDLAGRGGRVLYLVPSLALMSQTVREWAADARLSLRAYAACSDVQVGRRRRRNDDHIDMDALDLAFPATTDAAKLAEKASPHAPDDLTVVFATYHSLPVIGEAQRIHGLPDFDLAICDEAHRTAGARIKGEEDSHFVKIHDQAHIRAHRRLYMTATPKVYAPSARDKAGKVNAALCSMEDESLYGPALYEIGFGSAVEQGLLTDYKVIVLTVPENAVAHGMHESMARYELKLDDAGKLIGCWRALAKADEEEFPEDDQLPMRRAIAYCRDIKSSKQVEALFGTVVHEYRESSQANAKDEVSDYAVVAQHVDGTFNALRRSERLTWLDSVRPADGACHVLSNARCLAEGVDVPALDAILFMHPRKSQIDVVQAVGRVMRRAPGKQMGYVILPVVIPSNTDPTAALEKSDTFRVVWQVLNAIRSHDERFEAMLNLLEEGRSGKHLSIVALADWQPRPSNGRSTIGIGEKGNGDKDTVGKTRFAEPELFDLPAAIRAKIVEKCGNRRYWDEWAGDVAAIARRHIERISAIVTADESGSATLDLDALLADEAVQEIFEEFLDELRDDLNEGISKQDAIEMLAQHMVTRPVFEALHGDARFVDQNPVSKGMQLILDVLEPAHIEQEAESLEAFYDSVRRRAKAANTPLARQKIITELYDKFFRNAFPKTAQRLGIVYTPIEIVDFILHSVDEVLRTEFGQSLSSDGVQILDPFTGTGTFITRIIQNGLIRPEVLAKKYASEVHANEIMLLAYYIAAVNIEAAFHAAVGADEYQRFPGIILTDTFEMQDSPDLIANILPENSEQRMKQKDARIRVIVSNPPWSAGQKSENDAAQNQKYPNLDSRIATNYAHHSKATNKNSLYDSYVRAIRWASDRIGDSGVIGFVTNAGWLDGNAMDGMRKCLEEEFTGIHVLHLRGNARTQGDRRRAEGDPVFGTGSRAPVAITLLVRNPERHGCRILFHDIGDYLNREEKLNKVKEYQSIRGVAASGGWSTIVPDMYHDWLNQRDAGFAAFMALGDKSGGEPPGKTIFKNYSRGIATSRDAWCYNFSKTALNDKVQGMIRFYEAERQRLQEHIAVGRRLPKAEITRLVGNDATKISWSRGLKDDLRRNKVLSFEEGRIALSQYRPYTRQYVYFSRRLNDMVYQIPKLFPHGEAENRLICVPAKGVKDDFTCLMVDIIPDLNLITGGQCFPRWQYAKNGSPEARLFAEEEKSDAHGYVRQSAISKESTTAFAKKLGAECKVTADDLFTYVYGVLHLPSYRTKYQANLSKELPRIPIPVNLEDYRALVQAGEALGKLHTDYDDVEPWTIAFADGGWKPRNGTAEMEWFRVGKPMRHPGSGRAKDRTRIWYNDYITIKGIPEEAYDYMVNGKPAIAWVMERQCVKNHKASGIVNDANRYALETMQDPAYPLKLLARVIRVSIDTLRIVKQLPDPVWHS